MNQADFEAQVKLAELKLRKQELDMRKLELERSAPVAREIVAPTTGDLSTLVAVAKGERGEVGPQGVVGEKGETGLTGPRGADGLGTIGATGPAGERGLDGAPGVAGPKGDKGDTGEKGKKGDKGDTGPVGPPGPAGSSGGGYTGGAFTAGGVGSYGPSQASGMTVASPLTGTVQSVLEELSTAPGGPTSTADLPDSTDRRYVTDAQRTVIAATSGTNTGDQTSVTGNAGTATKLATARNIAGVSFDGSANISITTATIADSTDKRYVTDAQRTVIGNTSGSNSGDVTIGTGNGLSVASQALSMAAAGAAQAGAVTTGAQTIAGVKTFSSAPVLSAGAALGGNLVGDVQWTSSLDHVDNERDNVHCAAQCRLHVIE